MKWYDYIITQFVSYKWLVFIPFAGLMLWGCVLTVTGHSVKTPSLLFVVLLVMWFIIWIVATIFYRLNNKQNE